MKQLKFTIYIIYLSIAINCNNILTEARNIYKNNNHGLKKHSFIYTSFGDSIIRYYPDKAISDSLAVIEGLKTYVFGIAISNSKPYIYIFLNDSTWFTKDLSINKHVHLLGKENLNTDLKKTLHSHISKTITYNECDLKITTYYMGPDTIEYSSDRHNKFLEYASISSKGLDLIDLFEIGMSKPELFRNLGFNDIPNTGPVTIIIADPFNHMNDYESLWFDKYLTKIIPHRKYYGKNEIEYKLMFKNKKLQRIIIY